MNSGNVFTAEKVTIENLEFSIVPFKAIEALRLKARLAKILLPALGALSSLAQNDKEKKSVKNLMDIDLDSNTLTKTIEKVLSELDEDTFIELVSRILKNVIHKNEQVTEENTFNKLFMKHTMIVYKLIWKVLEVNYPDFLSGMSKNFGLENGTGTILEEKAEPKND